MRHTFHEIPVIDASPLLGGGEGAGKVDRAGVDEAIGKACEEIGFLVISGAALGDFASKDRLARLFRFFDLPEERRRPLARRRFVPTNDNSYRGYFPTVDGDLSFKEGIDIGPDFAADDPRYPLDHPLIERNVWPAEADLPGWRAEIAAHYAAMTDLGIIIMRSMARYLGLEENWFDPYFEATNSTLRLLHYPPRTEASLVGVADGYVLHGGVLRPVMAENHVDSGLLTLLYQDDTGGLQVRNGQGRWIDVPPLPNSFVVNLGGALQHWTDQRFVATAHRVLGDGRERFSAPFFFEPAVDAVMHPITAEGNSPHSEPIRYGDHLIRAMQSFVETRGVATGN
ncbi:hypothetical protein JL100_016695 [Skermanella mucosa]|uniref:isopenicillin N synthase family dioxygenase n=1 Tax=Skermanella mucosa TaxID=1789672 RepID=UPI00192B697D|nr:isopenicillin N synthase family oxygenase [Skermanella mucosa]UEM18735.1 hypothetical protein JL100_016695 [Skermanella mucosa]